jgi:colicin import membrane protein
MLPKSATEFLPGHRFRDLSSDRALKWIVFAVVLIHLAFFIFSAFFTPEKPLPKPVKQLIVKTITLNPIPQPTIALNEPIIPEAIIEPIVEQEPAAAPTPPPEPKTEKKPPVKDIKPLPEPKPTPKPTPPKPKPIEKPKPKPKKPVPAKPKKPVPKKEPLKKPDPKPKPAPKPVETSPPKPKVEPKIEAAKEEVAKKQATAKAEAIKAEAAKVEAARIEAAEAVKAKKRELLTKAQNSIAQLDTSNKLSTIPSSLNASVPSQIDALQVETFPDPSAGKLNSQEMSYYDELASRLKLLLRLPEFGEVKVKLTLERSGKFVKVTIENSKSDANRKYVEKTMPSLKFPSFGSNFDKMSQYTFVISLSNEL